MIFIVPLVIFLDTPFIINTASLSRSPAPPYWTTPFVFSSAPQKGVAQRGISPSVILLELRSRVWQRRTFFLKAYMMVPSGRHLDGIKPSALISPQGYLLQYILGTSDICQNLLDSVNGVIRSINYQSLGDTNAETFLTTVKHHGELSMAQLRRLESLAMYIRHEEAGDAISVLYKLRLSFDRLQAILGMYLVSVILRVRSRTQIITD